MASKYLKLLFGVAIFVVVHPLTTHADKPPIGTVPEIGDAGAPPLTEKITYLGITTKAVDPALQAQLKLPDGVGLIVTFVDAKGPAAADVKPGDVLQKFDDQILIDTHQLVTLVRMHHAGDSITLSLIHETRPTTTAIKLGEKEHHVVTAQTEIDPEHTYALPGVPQPDFDYQLVGPNAQVAMAFDDGSFWANVNTDKDGIKQMVVKNKAGTVVAKGPVETEQQWSAFPDEVRKHLEVLHTMLFKKRVTTPGVPARIRPPTGAGAMGGPGPVHVEVHTDAHSKYHDPVIDFIHLTRFCRANNPIMQA